MPDLSFRVEDAEAVPFAAAPIIALKLRVENADRNETIHTVVLRSQIQIEAPRREYTDADKARLADLFGEPERWSRTLRAMLWTHAGTVINSFQGSVLVDLQVHCTFDFNVAATKYFHGVSDGDIPIILLFSGTVFYNGPEGNLQVAPISWDKETRYRLPLKVWQEMMAAYYPNSTWLSLRKDVFERVYEYKVKMGIPTWEATFESLLAAAEQEAAPR
jgi:hypothetical protein